MSTQYARPEDVPSDAIRTRLVDLSMTLSQQRDRIAEEFTMRIPAECDRDADLVLYEAANRIERAESELARVTAEREKLLEDYRERVEELRSSRDQVERLRGELEAERRRISEAKVCRVVNERGQHVIEDTLPDGLDFVAIVPLEYDEGFERMFGKKRNWL